MLVSCFHMDSSKTAQRLSPEWWNIREARKEKHLLPQIYIIYNDFQLGWLYNNRNRLYNNGKRFSDEEFKAYVSGLAITKRCKEVRFIYGKNILGKKVIRKAVLYYE